MQYWGEKEKQEAASVIRTVGNKTSVLIRDLEGSSTYYMSLRAYNSAGVGPQSSIVNVTTKKPRKDEILLANDGVLFFSVFVLAFFSAWKFTAPSAYITIQLLWQQKPSRTKSESRVIFRFSTAEADN